jgi:hypothetical protein
LGLSDNALSIHEVTQKPVTREPMALFGFGESMREALLALDATDFSEAGCFIAELCEGIGWNSRARSTPDQDTFPNLEALLLAAD